MLLRSALQEAVLAQVVSMNVAADGLVEVPKKPKNEPEEAAAWTPEESAKSLESMKGDRLVGLWWLSMAGLRRSEILGFQRSDVGGEIVTIRRGRVSVGGKEISEKERKPKRSRRPLPLGDWPEVAEAIKTMRQKRAEAPLRLGRSLSEDDYLPVDELGKPLRPERYSDLFREAARRPRSSRSRCISVVTLRRH